MHQLHHLIRSSNSQPVSEGVPHVHLTGYVLEPAVLTSTRRMESASGVYQGVTRVYVGLTVTFVPIQTVWSAQGSPTRNAYQGALKLF